MKEHSGTEKGNRFMLKLARGIVDKRKLIFLFTLLLLIFSVFSSDWVKVENAFDAYLPEDSETRQGLDVMQEQFTTFGTARLMFANVTLEEAQAICRGMEESSTRPASTTTTPARSTPSHLIMTRTTTGAWRFWTA